MNTMDTIMKGSDGMGAFECWCAQKEKLRESLKDIADTAGVAYAVRHALAQVEQNTMAEQTDDLLRQQTGILFSCVKTASQMLDVPVSQKVWVAAPRQKEKRAGNPLLWVVALLAQLAAGIYAYFTGQLIVWLLLLGALVVTGIALITAGKSRKRELPQDEVRVTLHPDQERLFGLMDAQMHAIDRYVSDFAYLNEQSLGRQKAPDSKAVTLVADMLEALYECDDEARAGAGAAAIRMLEGLGLEAVEYSPESRHLFTTLPSKTETRTMIPAIVLRDDHKLLRRGTAAVRLSGAQEAQEGEHSRQALA